MDIVIYLQVTLKMDIGGKPAEALADFYTAVFALMLQGSQANSREKFEQVIAYVRNVRDAWRQVAKDPEVDPIQLQGLGLSSRRIQPDFDKGDCGKDSSASSNWKA